MNTVRRAFIAGLMAIVVAVATMASLADEAWPYDSTGDLRESLDMILVMRIDCACEWHIRDGESQLFEARMIRDVVMLLAKASHDGTFDIVVKFVGNECWCFEHAKTREQIPITESWLMELYRTYKEYYANEGNTANNG